LEEENIGSQLNRIEAKINKIIAELKDNKAKERERRF
jgi:hypothetical protein